MRSRITRREFGAAGVAAFGNDGRCACRRLRKMPRADRRTAPSPPQFPPGFVWGVATAAYQIEGSPDADGKGKSIWDTYSHIPGKIKNGDTGDVANDHYRLYRQDVAMMKEMGAKAYRFSISWPRIFPEGAGTPNRKGMDFYNRLVDELLAAGIEPFATLYHWDLPQALQDKVGGWQSRETAKAFGDYSGHVARGLSDRVRHFFTINEFSVFVELGHRGIDTMADGKPSRIEHAPGLRLSPAGAQSGPPSCRARSWIGGAGHSRAGATGDQGGTCGEYQHRSAGDRECRAYQGGGGGDARSECALSRRDPGRQIQRRLSGRCRQGCAEIHRRGFAHHLVRRSISSASMSTGRRLT